MTTELKPCPNPNCIGELSDLEDSGSFIHCGYCGTCGPSLGRGYDKGWNDLPRAPQPADRDAEIESLARELFVHDKTLTPRHALEHAEEYIKFRELWRTKQRQLG